MGQREVGREGDVDLARGVGRQRISGAIEHAEIVALALESVEGVAGDVDGDGPRVSEDQRLADGKVGRQAVFRLMRILAVLQVELGQVEADGGDRARLKTQLTASAFALKTKEGRMTLVKRKELSKERGKRIRILEISTLQRREERKEKERKEDERKEDQEKEEEGKKGGRKERTTKERMRKRERKEEKGKKGGRRKERSKKERKEKEGSTGERKRKWGGRKWGERKNGQKRKEWEKKKRMGEEEKNGGRRKE